MAKKETTQDEIRRVDFILDEQELQLERGAESEKLFDDLDVSPESIMANPITLLLSNFDNEYMKSERIAIVIFEFLQSALTRYTKMVNSNFYYQDMEIVQIVNDLLTRYNTWIANQRGTLLNTRDMMKTFKKMVEEEYITRKSLDQFKEEVKMQLEEEKKNTEEGNVKIIDGKLFVELPTSTNYKVNENVLIKKSRRN